MTARPDGYTTFPGLTGQYQLTPDLNEIDADTAHPANGKTGIWAPGVPVGITFEDGGAEWDPLAGRIVIPAAVGQSSPTWTLGQLPDVTPGQEYTLSVRARLQSTGTTAAFCKAKAWAYLNNAGGVTDAVNGPTSALTTDWSTLAVTITPATGNTMRLTVDIEDNTAPVEICSIIMREGDQATFYPSLRIVGDLDIRADFDTAAASVDDRHIIGCYDTAGNKRQYRLFRRVIGEQLRLEWTTDGTLGTAQSSTTPDWGLPGRSRVRVTLRDTAPGWEVTWYKDDVQVDQDTNPTTALPFAGDSPCTVGAFQTGLQPFDGEIYSAEVRDGIDGPLVAHYVADHMRLGWPNPPDFFILPQPQRIQLPGFPGV